MNISGFIGILFFIAGIILFIGNVTGCYTSFSFAGFIFMTLGGLLLRVAGDD